MPTRIAINGLGRIGRCVLRAAAQHHQDIEIIAVNGPAPIETHLHLLKYDSVHGIFPQVKQIDNNTLDIGHGPIKLYQERDPKKLPWQELDIDIVLECTGRFNSYKDSAQHITAGAKKVIISAPAKEVDATIVYGVNDETITPEHKIISIGSCTTNCLAPVAKVLNDTIGIQQGFVTTIHAFTGDQNIVDNSHKDLRRARTASTSIIPTSTGAAKAIGLVLPELAGKLDGCAIRVPTPNVSLIDFTFTASDNTTADTINKNMQQAANDTMKNILAYNTEPLVSIDFNHNPHSAIFDATSTKVINQNLCRIAAWYDNEWAFSIRMLDVAKKLANSQ